MRSIPNQPQTSRNDERWYYAPQQGPEDPSVEGNGYQPQEYSSEQPYPPYYRGRQQQYCCQLPSYRSVPGEVSPFERTSMGMRARTAGLLCYLFAWIGGVVFLFLEPNNRFVRFHAMQSILFFGTLSILEWICDFFPVVLLGVSGVLGLVSFIGWIVLMVAASRGKYYKLPIFGDYAEKWANQLTI